MGAIDVKSSLNVFQKYREVIYSNSFIGESAGSFEPETTDYISRVEADGGEVINPTYVNEAFSLLKSKGILATDYSWLSASFGLIKDVNNNVSKLYSLKGAQWDLIGANILSATWKSTGSQTSMPVITFDRDRAVYFRPSSVIVLSQPNTIFSVHSTVHVGGNQYVYGGYSQSGRHLLLRESGKYLAGASPFPTTTVGADANTHIIQVNVNGNSSSMYVDDITALSSTNMGTGTFYYITLGSAYSPRDVYSLGGDWSELLVLDGGISTADIEIRELLNGKYNTYI